MKHKVVLSSSSAIIAMLLIAGCASEPRYVEPDGDTAHLQNRTERQGQARLDYFFEYADQQKLGPGFWSLQMPADVVNKIRPGKTVVGLRILYTPAYGKNIFARGNDLQYFIFVRDLGFTADRIQQMTEQIAEAEPGSLSGLGGLSFDAEVGHTYQIGCRIENGQAFIWIEEPDGSIVSDAVQGFADAQYTVHTVMEMGMHSGQHGPPNLVGGWRILDDLPDPVQ